VRSFFQSPAVAEGQAPPGSYNEEERTLSGEALHDRLAASPAAFLTVLLVLFGICIFSWQALETGLLSSVELHEALLPAVLAAFMVTPLASWFFVKHSINHAATLFVPAGVVAFLFLAALPLDLSPLMALFMVTVMDLIGLQALKRVTGMCADHHVPLAQVAPAGLMAFLALASYADATTGMNAGATAATAMMIISMIVLYRNLLVLDTGACDDCQVGSR